MGVIRQIVSLVCVWNKLGVSSDRLITVTYIVSYGLVLLTGED